MKEEYWNTRIQKHLDGSCSAEERVEMEAWLSESEEHRRQYEELAFIDAQLKQLDFSMDPKSEEEWQRLKATLARNQPVEKVIPIRRRNWMRVAASFLVLLAVGWLFSEYFGRGEDPPALAVEYRTADGETKTIRLADGTEVELNASSLLTVGADFNQDQRSVRLSGEAWFKVAKDAQRAFTIESSGIFTQVLGTVFTLRAYPAEETVELAVEEGKVRFFKEEAQAIIVEGKNAGTFHKKSGKIEKTEYEPLLSNAWRSQDLQFDNTPFKTALRILERRFDLTITDETGNFNDSLTAQFDANTSLEQIVEQLELLYGLEIEIKNRQLFIRK